MRQLVFLLGLVVVACGRADQGPSEPIFEIIIDQSHPANPDLAGCWVGEHDTANGVRQLQICIDFDYDPTRIVLSAPQENTAEILLTQGGVSGDRIYVGTPLGAVRLEGVLSQSGTIEAQYYQGTQGQLLILHPADPR